MRFNEIDCLRKSNWNAWNKVCVQFGLNYLENMVRSFGFENNELKICKSRMWLNFMGKRGIMISGY